jgi:amino acid transporter
MKKKNGHPFQLLIMLLAIGTILYFYIYYPETTSLSIAYFMMLLMGYIAFFRIKESLTIMKKRKVNFLAKIILILVLLCFGYSIFQGWKSYINTPNNQLHHLVVITLAEIFLMIAVSTELIEYKKANKSHST